MSFTSRRVHAEDGAALLIALAFVFTMAVILTGILALADHSLISGQRVAAQRDLIYAADSGLEAAINHVAHDDSLAIDEGGDPECWPASAPFQLPTLNGVTIEVDCEASENSGADTGVGADENNAPGQAILTLSGSEPLTQASNSTLRVGGHVHSHAGIVTPAANAHMEVVRGDVQARGACDESKVTVTGAYTRVCGPSATPVGDPGYPLLDASGAPLTAPPPRRAVPPCTGSVVTFEPGWYDDAAALSSCAGNRVLHFTPGLYYFDFTASASKTWEINSAPLTVIGGTPVGGTPSRANGCLREPEAPAGTAGVQFVFGGESRMNVQSGHVELCPTVTTDRQQISIYGVRQDSGPGPQDLTLTSTSGASTSTPAFGNAGSGAAVDGEWAVAEPLAVGNSAMLRVSQFSPELAVPEGSSIERVRLRVTHREVDLQRIAVRVTSAGGETTFQSTNSANCNNQPLCRSTSTRTDVIDLTSWVQEDARRLEDLGVEYTATAVNNPNAEGRAELDGIEFEVAYTPPVLRATSGCAASGSSCPVVRIDGANSTLSTTGTVYVPHGAIDVNMPNAAQPVFMRGITARTALLSITPSSLGDSPFPDFVSVPGWGPGGREDRNASFTARCVATSSTQDPCPDPPVLARARVTFERDSTNTTIDHWRISSGGLP
jgi:hypothetical protein